MMRDDLIHLRATLRRWSARDSFWLLLALAVAFWGPGIWDRHIRERPWISAALAIERPAYEGPALLIRDIVEAHSPVSGERLIWIEDQEGARLCGSHREDGWEGRSVRTWSAEAFFDHACRIPEAPWRACTRFVVLTEWGSRGSFGPYCSEMFDPRTGADHRR